MSAALKKDKAITLKGDEADELVLTYLIAQNRPYGATDVSANLKGKVTKLQAQKSLTSLMEKGEIVGKMYGKTWVFCAKQVTTETLEPASLVDLESSIVALKSSQSSLSTSVKDFAQVKSQLLTTERTSNLPTLIASLSTSIQTLSASLTPLRSPSTPSITSLSLSTLSQTFESTHITALKVKKIGLDIQSMLTEGMRLKRGSTSEVWEEAGGEAVDEGVWEEVEKLREREGKGKGQGKK